jgi:hypothetical protein
MYHQQHKYFDRAHSSKTVKQQIINTGIFPVYHTYKIKKEQKKKRRYDKKGTHVKK